ncbi:hypothetical protein CVN68_11645 [Sphingomonas psychrotolerans]|uniref:Uncharacterized protein n=2 Tax=Sphingomonas psychrotolerans TaxID=1327635 RepID=A0A2K8MJ12_9SPHN|nr:hypothetical protein CVN68_11645 [Sphingomonas psychrotolerans]
MVGEGKRVAVVGGGLSGITTAAALLAKRCSVHLYETQGRVLGIQKQAAHRFIHPTINFWPEIFEETAFGPMIMPTTELPFFDWYANIGSTIMLALREEWRRYFKPRLSAHNISTTVTSLSEKNKKVTIFATGRGPEKSEPFDVVVLAMGFGPERTVAGVEPVGYWESDDWYDSEGDGPTPVVAGIGDGGLIDALRAIHTRFEAGRLCAEVVRLLASSSVPALVRDLEGEVLGANLDKDAAAEAYARGYARIYELDTPDLVKDVLNTSLRKPPFDPVLLVGPAAFPFSKTAAPIHKFMITHALDREAVDYQQGRLEDGPILKRDGAEEPIGDRPKVVRRGPERNFGGVIATDLVDKVAQRQVVMGDLLKPAPYGASDWMFPGYPPHRPADPIFAKFRLDKAEEYIKSALGTPLSLGVSRDGVVTYFVAPELGRTDLEERIPPRLFGVRTLLGDCPVIHV